jgi:hypothetical protein
MTTALAKPEPTAPLIPAEPPVDKKGHAQLLVMKPPAPDSGPAWGLVKRTARGDVLAMQVEVPLSAALGHFQEIPGTKGLSISIDGYQYLNKVMGISRIVPSRILGNDGKEHPNPFYEYDSDGNLIRIVYKVGGWGRNAAGNCVLQWAFIYYEVRAYFASKLYETWAPKQWENRKYMGRQPGKEWGLTYSSENLPADAKKDPRKKCLPLEGGLTMVLDLSHPEVTELLISDYSKMVKFAQRVAESIGWERVLRVFTGARRVVPDLKGGPPAVTVTAWISPEASNLHDVEKLAEAAQAGKVDFHGEGVEVKSADITIDGANEEDHIAVSSVMDAEPEQSDTPSDASAPPLEPAGNAGPSVPARTAPAQPGQAPSASEGVAPAGVATPSILKKRNQITSLHAKVNPQVGDEILGSVGIDGLAELRHIVDHTLLDQAITLMQGEEEKQKKDRARRG